MRKTGVLHARLAGLLAELGHGDTLVIADAGLPIPPGVERIDLALVPSVPGFLETLSAVVGELVLESAIIAEEMSSELNRETARLLGELPVRAVSHTELKALSRAARAVVRTGEFSPYANIILVAGVAF